MRKINVPHSIYGDKMDMGVRHFKPHNSHPNTFTGDCFTNSLSHFFGKELQLGKESVIYIKNIVYLFFRNYKRMAFYKGKNIKKSKAVSRFSYFIARYFTRNYLTENRWHYRQI